MSDADKKKSSFGLKGIAIIILVAIVIGIIVGFGSSIQDCYGDSGDWFKGCGEWCGDGCDSGYGNWSGS